MKPYNFINASAFRRQELLRGNVGKEELRAGGARGKQGETTNYSEARGSARGGGSGEGVTTLGFN